MCSPLSCGFCLSFIPHCLVYHSLYYFLSCRITVRTEMLLSLVLVLTRIDNGNNKIWSLGKKYDAC